MTGDKTMPHTPTPWRVEEGTTLIWGDCLLGDGGAIERLGIPVADAQRQRSWSHQSPPVPVEANAALIVRAVNALEPMREALRRLHEMASFEAGTVNPGQPFWDALAEARAALSLAGGANQGETK